MSTRINPPARRAGTGSLPFGWMPCCRAHSFKFTEASCSTWIGQRLQPLGRDGVAPSRAWCHHLTLVLMTLAFWMVVQQEQGEPGLLAKLLEVGWQLVTVLLRPMAGGDDGLGRAERGHKVVARPSDGSVDIQVVRSSRCGAREAGRRRVVGEFYPRLLDMPSYWVSWREGGRSPGSTLPKTMSATPWLTMNCFIAAICSNG